MPLLHIDLALVARDHPDLLPPPLLRQPVCAQLARLASASSGRDDRLHALARAALAVLAGPQYVSLHALRMTAHVRSVLGKTGWDGKLPAALSGTEARPSLHHVGAWYSDQSLRPLLWLTSRDLDDLAREFRESGSSSAARV